ncbi:hypothetical protein [Cellulosimicrobium aquatile]|uniref:hypothetical protein n=1 Tax=Cellulosimicrobium aquatile TaxID=1612203 RepID=UPI001459ABE0|nr:hypothetical protein [Cellulosimicrobium aquatile]NMF29246.1 hypothetical protein [Cellulosimicrobium aquatile]
MSSQKAEQIYDARQDLRSLKDYILKLEVQQSMGRAQGLSENAQLEERIAAARSKREQTEAEIAQMEEAYEEWLREAG